MSQVDDQEEEYRRWCVRGSLRGAAGPGRVAHRRTAAPAAAGMGSAGPAGSVGPGTEAVDGSDASAAAVPAAAAASPETNTLQLLQQCDELEPQTPVRLLPPRGGSVNETLWKHCRISYDYYYTTMVSLIYCNK